MYDKIIEMNERNFIILNKLYNEEQFKRTTALIGINNLEKLINSKVLVFGVGGVGGYVVEGLCRSGVGYIGLVDNDVVSVSNINRQIIATYDSLGEYKVDIMAKRIKSINPNAHCEIYKTFYLKDNEKIDFSIYDYIIDCIDTVSSKIAIIEKAKKLNIPVISSMGTGNKIDPTKFKVSDISKTSMCPLARVMRYELKKRKITDVKVVYSTEEPFNINLQTSEDRKSIPASSSFVPPVCGFIIASEVIKDLIK